MTNIFSFCNQKGGVGKTTSVINISSSLAKFGYRVLVIDLDAQANATSGLGQEKPSIDLTTYQLVVDAIDPREIIRETNVKNLFLIPSSADLSGAEIELINRDRREFSLRSQLEKISDEFDFIFIDCPPSLGLITINALVACNYVVIPLQCEYYALEGLGQLIYTVQLVRDNLSPSLDVGGVILTMADFRTNLTQQVIEEVNNFFKDKVFKTIIPRSVKLSEAPSFGKPAVVYDPSNRGSKSYVEIAKEFEKRFAEKNKTQSTPMSPDPEVSRETVSQEAVTQPISTEAQS